MLTDAALKHLKPKEKIYKVTDRDGMYVLVQPSGTALVSARLPDERTARDRHVRQVRSGRPVARSSARAVHRRQAGDRRGTIAGDREAAREAPAPGSEELRRVRREVADRGADGGQHAGDAPIDLRARAAAGVAQAAADRDHAGRPAGALWRRSSSAARRRRRSTSATSSSRSTASRSCTARRSPTRLTMSARLRSRPSCRRTGRSRRPRSGSCSSSSSRWRRCRPSGSACGSILLTMVRKSELQDAIWDEVDFENAVWTIPKERMKRSKAHNVYLSRQMLDIMIALKTCAGNSRYLLAVALRRGCADVARDVQSRHLSRSSSGRRRKGCRWSRSPSTTCGGRDRRC